jgi:hypothetical protein
MSKSLSSRHQLAVGLAVILVIVQAIGMAILPAALNDWFLTTPDAGGWACGAQTLADTGAFSDGHTAGLGYNFNVCWDDHTYPGLQYLLAASIQVTGLAGSTLIPPVLTIALVGLALTMMMIGWKLSQSLWVATFAGLATSATPIVLRSLILTPQNLFGYWLIALLLLTIIQLVESKRWWWWLVLVTIAGILGYVHSLSFGVAGLSCALWFYCWYLPNWWWRLGILVAGALGALVIWQFPDLLPVSPQNAIALFTSGGFAGYDHPLYDHPAFLGYGLVAVAGIGLLFATITSKTSKGLLISWLVVPTLLGHLSLIGWILMPDRFIAYIWFSCVVLAALGLERLRHLITWSVPAWLGMAILLWGAQLVHAIVYVQDDVSGWSDRFKPHPEFVEALQWLNQQDERGTLVGIMAAANREIIFSPIWYDGPVASYPWYNLNHRNLKSFKANSSLYQGIFADTANPEYLRVQAFYYLLTKPNSAEALTATQQYHLSYLILPKGSQADEIWEHAAVQQFNQVYENTKYRLYQLN